MSEMASNQIQAFQDWATPRAAHTCAFLRPSETKAFVRHPQIVSVVESGVATAAVQCLKPNSESSTTSLRNSSLTSGSNSGENVPRDYDGYVRYLIVHEDIRWWTITECASVARRNHSAKSLAATNVPLPDNCIAAFEAQRVADKRLSPRERSAVDAELRRYVLATQKEPKATEGVEPLSKYPIRRH